MLEIVEGEAVRSTGAPRLSSEREGLVSVGCMGGRNKEIVPLWMPSVRLRCEVRSLRPSGSAY